MAFLRHLGLNATFWPQCADSTTLPLFCRKRRGGLHYPHCVLGRKAEMVLKPASYVHYWLMAELGACRS